MQEGQACDGLREEESQPRQREQLEVCLEKSTLFSLSGAWEREMGRKMGSTCQACGFQGESGERDGYSCKAH